MPVVQSVDDVFSLYEDLGGSQRHKFSLPAPHAVSDVITRDVLTATPETPICEIIEVILSEKIGAIPTLNETHEPVGILTTTDILRALFNRAHLEL